MGRNLVLIHLESLNNFIYKMNPAFFPFLREIEQKSVSFLKYFSTATSTLMALADVYYGGMEQYEQCTSLAYVPEKYHYKSSLFDNLKMRGYQTGLFVYPDGNDRDTAEMRHIAGFHNTMELKEDYNEYLAAVESIMGEQPFALSLCNYISNLTYNIYADLNDNMTGRESWEAGLKALDRSIKDIFELLNKKNVLNNTTIIFYGDHGDDYWVHKSLGRTHPIEPYTNLIHTPMMIYDNRLKAEYNSKLLCATDIRDIVEKLLFSDDIKSYLPSHDTIVSRIVYAAQPVYFSAMRKSYSITDGSVLLLVSNDGFEMYDVEMDPLCTNNLLYVFRYEEGILINKENYFRNANCQYTTLMTLRQIRYIRQRFYYLKVRLYREVEKLYAAGGFSVEKMNDEMNFDKLRKINNLNDDE